MRRVTLLDVHTGRLVGPLQTPVPWWPEVQPIVELARQQLGLEITVLRLLDADTGRHGGDVTYLVERAGSTSTADIDDHPLRLPWARPGGPAADVAWACSQLADGDRVTAVQVKTWNLSSIWRLDGPEATHHWLKVVPPFFEHEGPLIDWLAGRRHPVPRLIVHEGNRVLMAHTPGDDGHDAGPDHQRALAAALVRLQADAQDHRAELLQRGLPDWSDDRLAELLDDTVGRHADRFDRSARQRLAGLVATTPDRLRRAREAGIADSVQHIDPHPGNARFGDRPADLTILDWGDAAWGCPLLDLARLPDITDDWLALWAEQIPGSEPRRVWPDIRPVAHLQQAMIYQRFLDHIEPTERRYHHLDVEPALHDALDALA